MEKDKRRSRTGSSRWKWNAWISLFALLGFWKIGALLTDRENFFDQAISLNTVHSILAAEHSSRPEDNSEPLIKVLFTTKETIRK